ncbi:macro domain-containing protein [Ketobacter sp.]|uniref:macro domain-containing protein n=1 Tax=Ketobacter sp. TaxID=2083498 RepID=UPI0025BBB604|nr:macro domain-containing protein [Ketobacter sp.]
MLDQRVDALIYSTNAHLNLSGGVGKSLIERFGGKIQERLIQSARDQVIGKIEPGFVINCRTEAMPWRLLIHTVATDDMYYTDPEIVRSVLADALDICDQTYGVSVIATSALGCGYGDLTHQHFAKILASVVSEYRDTDLTELRVVCNSIDYVYELKSVLG